jgi:uncharacterized protein (TIGR03435 family)
MAKLSKYPHCTLTQDQPSNVSREELAVIKNRPAFAALMLVATVNGPVAQAQSQPTAAKLQFEVASVRISVPTLAPAGGGAGRTGGFGGGGPVCRAGFSITGGRVDIQCFTLAALMGHAFRIPPDRIVGPDWIAAAGATKFDIAAKLPEGASEAQVPEMLQALLEDRFKLTIHRENKEETVYGLVVAKGGLKAKGPSPDASAPVPDADTDTLPSPIVNIGGVQTIVTGLPPRNGGSATSTMSSPLMGTVRVTTDPNRERLEAESMTFEGLAGLLTTMMVAPVAIVDMTGLKGRYQLALEISWQDIWQDILAARQAASPQSAIDPALDPAVTAAQLREFRRALQNIGLQLEPRKGPVETIVVDHLEKAPTEN